LPPEQSIVQLVDESHSTLQSPPEQSTSHADESSHVPSHAPDEQLHTPAAQSSGFSGVPEGRGSGSEAEELQPATTTPKSTAKADRMRRTLC
jgi:hypothetical protein